MHDLANGLSIEADEIIHKRAKSAWKKVLGLIGYFDLDPNRALDIVLDLFVSHAPSHHTFFLALLRHSPWCRNSVKRSLYDDKHDVGASNSAGQNFEQILLMNEEYVEKENDGLATPLCAQIMGFKFAHYQVSKARWPLSLLKSKCRRTK